MRPRCRAISWRLTTAASIALWDCHSAPAKDGVTPTNCRSESFVPSADDSSRLPPHEIETVSGWVSVAATSAGVLITALWSQDFGVKIAGKRRRSSKYKGDGEILTAKPCAAAAALMAAIIEAACAAPAAGSDSILLMVA